MLFSSRLDIKTGLLKVILIQLLFAYGACSNDYPQLIKLPQDFIFASTMYESISFNVIMSPCEAKFLLLVRYFKSSHSPKYEFHTLYDSSKEFFSISSSSDDPLTINVTTDINRYHNYLSVNITLNEWINIQHHPLHIRVISDLGSIISPPMRIQIYQLSKFEESENENVEFLMGNVAQILCRLPVSKPSPPKIEFHHNSNLINISNSSRYKLVEFPPSFQKVALLIRNLVEEDSGQYKCAALLPNTKLYQTSIKTTNLIVKKPHENIPLRFLMSSHYNADENNKIIDVRIPEGTLLVLYCIFESAPIDEVNWYWSKTDRKYELNSQFGTLTIQNATLRDNTDISCMNNEDKIFRIHVYQKPKLIAKPSRVEIRKSNLNKSIILKCKYNQNDKGKYNVNWLYNGITISDEKSFEIKNHSLTIKKLSIKNQGIYQCWTEMKTEWMSDKIVIFISRQKPYESPKIITKTVYIDSDKPMSLRCEIPINYHFYNSTVKWFKEYSKKEISHSNMDFEKRQDFEKNVYSLTLKRPRILRNNEIFICKILMKENKKIILRKIQFKLFINKVNNQNQPPYSTENPKELLFYFKLTKPNATRQESFLLAVNVTWSLETSIPDINHSKIINHYRIEYRQGTLERKPLTGKPIDNLINWTNATIIDKSFTNVTCLIHNSQILKPKHWYSFRAVGIPNIQYVQLKFAREKKFLSKNFFQEIRSPWSDPVNFENIMQSRPQISNVTILNSESALISWIYNPLLEIQDDKSKSNIEFKILYRAVPSENVMRNLKPMDEQVSDLINEPDFYFNELTFDKIEEETKISSFYNEKTDFLLTNLKPRTQYMVAVYAIHRPLTGMSKMFTALSEPFMMDTSLFESKNKFNENSNNSRNQTVVYSNYFRNKILFLVLGSLAGILFVIALFMFIMCLWYQIRYHNKKRHNMSSASSVKTSSATTFAPVNGGSQIQNNSVFITSSNIVSPQGLSPWNKSNRFPNTSEFPHLYLAQHLSLWSPNHLAQFNLPSNLQDQMIDETKIKNPNLSPTTLSTPSPKSNIDLEINNLDGSIEDSQEESVRLLDYQSHSSGFKRDDQCTLNNAFSVKSEGRERQNDQDANSDNTRSISHYPFSPSALELYSHKKKSKVCSSNRKDLSNIKIHLKQPKLQNSNYFLPIRSRLSCFFPSAPTGESPPPCTPVISSLCKDNSLNQYNRMKKDETFAEHPFLTTDHVKNGFANNYGNGSFKYHYSPTNNNFNNQKPSSKFIFDPIHDLQPHDDSRSNSTAASARQFLFSLYPDGVRPSINLDLDKQASNSQTNL